jgi:hypothetical protein
MASNHCSTEMSWCYFTLIDRDRGEECPTRDTNEDSTGYEHDRIDAASLNRASHNEQQTENV